MEFNSEFEIVNKKGVSNKNRISEKKFKCLYEGCNLSFRKPSALSWHINVHLKEKPYKCTFEGCNKAYSNPSHLKRHALNHNKMQLEKYKCKSCLKYFSNTSSLKRHCKRKHNENANICKFCNKKVRKQCDYNEHIICCKSQLSDSKSFKCDICGKKLLNFCTLQRHRRKHLNEYSCPFEDCSEKFRTKILLEKHKSCQHQRSYICDICNKEFFVKQYLRNHILTHLQERETFHCAYKNCTRIYYFKKNLKQHIRLFHLNRKFKCDICNDKLSTRQKLNQHNIKIHGYQNNHKKKNVVKKEETMEEELRPQFLPVFVKEEYTI